MTRRRVRLFAAFALALAVGTLPFALGAQSPSATFAARLNDQEFWKLVGELSEANGSFRSDNLLSNEARLQYVIPELQRISKPGGAYIGVGPEQNFTLIAALKPAVAFIVDIRRGNLDLQLLYKAVFEMSADRADFVGRLFSRARPTTLRPKSSVADIFAAYSRVEPSETLFNDNLKAVDSLLTSKHGYALSADDLKGIEYVYNAFFTYGPAIQYSSSDGFGGGGEPSYVDIMVATDATGRQRGFLASDEAYAAVKDLEARNLVVPVVGDFAGPKAIRGVGKYVRGSERHRVGVLRLERRAVSAPVQELGRVLRQRADAARRRYQHAHPGRPRRARGARQHHDRRDGADGQRDAELRQRTILNRSLVIWLIGQIETIRALLITRYQIHLTNDRPRKALHGPRVAPARPSTAPPAPRS